MDHCLQESARVVFNREFNEQIEKRNTPEIISQSEENQRRKGRAVSYFIVAPEQFRKE